MQFEPNNAISALVYAKPFLNFTLKYVTRTLRSRQWQC